MVKAVNKGDYSSLPLYRLCFVCGHTEEIDVKEETPLPVKSCPDCGSRMFALNAVEAFHGGFIEAEDIPGSILDQMKIIDTGEKEGSIEPLTLEILESKFVYRTEVETFARRLKKTFDLSSTVGLRMLRAGAVLETKEWKSDLMGSFRQGGSVSTYLLSALYSEGRFTLRDAKSLFDVSVRVVSDGVSVREANGKKTYLKVLEGVDLEWFIETARNIRKSGQEYRLLVLAASVCRPMGEETVSSDVAPGNVVRSKDAKSYERLMKDRFSDEKPDMINWVEGVLHISEPTHESYRKLAELGCACYRVVDEALIVSAKQNQTKAKSEVLKPDAGTTMDSELDSGTKAVFKSLVGALQDASDFVTVDHIKGFKMKDITKHLETLERGGYIIPVVRGYAYQINPARLNEGSRQEAKVITVDIDVVESGMFFDCPFRSVGDSCEALDDSDVDYCPSDAERAPDGCPLRQGAVTVKAEKAGD